MDPHEQDPTDDGPSLAWFGHPPDTEAVAGPETPAAEESGPSQDLDVYSRVVMSALVVGGALLLARSRTFRQVTWRLAKFALTTWLPARLATEVRHAWRDAAASEGVVGDVGRSQ
jgi:hypothetical protein